MKYMTTILILFSSLLSYSLIQGKVLNLDSKKPIVGANVYVEGLAVGTQTDEFGVFFIESSSFIESDLDKIKISHIAYLDSDCLINDSRFYTIFLEPSVINSEELIVTGTRTPKTFKDSPVLTRIVSAQEIKDSQSRDLYDIMDEIFPGYQKLKGEHSMSNEIRFKGLGTKSILFMIDGKKINAEYGGNMDLSVIDVNNIEKIEYVEGSISTLYGSGAMGGAVNIITKNPTNNSYSLNVNLFSDNPSMHSGHISYMQDWGIVSGIASISLNESDGFDLKNIEYTNDDQPIQKHQEEFSNLNTNVKINFDFEKINLTINHSDYLSSINTYKMDDLDNDPFTDFLSIVPEFELPRNYNSHTSFKLEFQRDESTLINYNFSTEDYLKKYKYTGFGEQLWSASYTKNQSLIINKLFSKGSVLFGLDITNDEYASYDIDADGDGDIDEFSIFNDGTSRHVQQHSLFINNEWITNSISITSGLRYQYHETYQNNIIPMLSIYKKYNQYKLRGTWSKGYRAPNLKELYYEWNHPGGTVLGDSTLKPEESEYISLSLESFKDFYYSINIYKNSLKNMINYLTEGSNHIYTNFEKVTLNGISIFYKRKLSRSGELTFSYNYLDAYDHILDARLNGSNFHNLNTKLTYFILDNLKARLSLKYSSPKSYTNCVQECDGDASNDVFELSEFSLVDFSMRYNFLDNISMTIGVNNLFDYKDPNASNEQFLTLINPGRTTFVSIDYNIRGVYEK